MRIDLAYITPRRQRLKSGAAHDLLQAYLERSGRYEPTRALPFESEQALLAEASRSAGRTPARLVLLDSRGEALPSEGIAALLQRWRDDGTQQILFAIGPPDGWTDTTRRQAQRMLSLGAITLPHELALVVLAEQVYRALTILAGHPYHTGHGA